MWFRDKLDELSSLSKPVLNALSFQCCWFMCVLGGNRWALLATSVFLLLHLIFFLKNRRELLLLAAVPCVGVAIDGLLIRLGVLQTLDGVPIPPVWLMCLWLSFALTLCHSLVWLWRYLPLAALAGAVAGPSSYGAGVALGAMHFGLSSASAAIPWVEILVYGLVWAVLLPIFALWARWVEQSPSSDKHCARVRMHPVKHNEP